MGKPPFVDAHFHSFDLTHPELRWDWLAPGTLHPNLGDIDAIKSQKYLLEHFIAESRHSGVHKAVHVEADIAGPHPVAETVWLEEAADRTGLALAIVADADLRDPAVGDVLEAHSDHPRVRGVRDFSHGDYLVAEDFHRGYALLERFGLSCDLDCRWEDMEKARDLASRYPGVTMILDHAGFPQERTDAYFADWRRGLQTLAEAESAVVKVSGLGMRDPQWTVESLRPWVLGCIEAFGVERSFFGTNWPVDRLFSSYADVVDAYREIVADFSADERQALFVGNAERIYRF